MVHLRDLVVELSLGGGLNKCDLSVLGVLLELCLLSLELMSLLFVDLVLLLDFLLLFEGLQLLGERLGFEAVLEGLLMVVGGGVADKSIISMSLLLNLIEFLFHALIIAEFSLSLRKLILLLLLLFFNSELLLCYLNFLLFLLLSILKFLLLVLFVLLNFVHVFDCGLLRLGVGG